MTIHFLTGERNDLSLGILGEKWSNAFFDIPKKDTPQKGTVRLLLDGESNILIAASVNCERFYRQWETSQREPDKRERHTGILNTVTSAQDASTLHGG